MPKRYSRNAGKTLILAPKVEADRNGPFKKPCVLLKMSTLQAKADLDNYRVPPERMGAVGCSIFLDSSKRQVFANATSTKCHSLRTYQMAGTCVSLTAICGELCTQVNSRERRHVTRPTEKKTLSGSWEGSAKSAD